MILLASSLNARLCVRTFVVCWLVSTTGKKEELGYKNVLMFRDLNTDKSEKVIENDEFVFFYIKAVTIVTRPALQQAINTTLTYYCGDMSVLL